MRSENSNSAENKKGQQAKGEHQNPGAVKRIRELRKRIPSAEELTRKITEGDTIALSQAITLIESTRQQHREIAARIVSSCLPYANRSVRLGITGVPGVGKSTFIESFGSFLTGKDRKVAVLAVDPSSSVSHGSILGDKTRMEELVKDPNAFIRPSPAGSSLGGVARKTRETIILCEACGFDTVIVETVGVGQSETAVHGMVDFFLLLKLSGAGDELQGIKRGIMEMADGIVINKADGDNKKKAAQAKTEFQRALHLYPPKASNWAPEVRTASALNNEGIADIWEMISRYLELVQGNGYFTANRKSQNRQWLLQTIDEQLKSSFYEHPNIKEDLKEKLEAVENNETSPFMAARELLDKYRKHQDTSSDI
ncbi:methylmalonyl Co-A mutase-associated GTPase MeaB [Robertkochia aurantiaca]|uniref:methylmalonyl Co-A mutase-associated GTPase MeaB n=1 Tax=Robertkochia aurantiaca TaxID=2873700 RepID=UPI001CCFC6B4|nr:methylmalonyl Co-A mutase-associated GTPase MeaB [Robertkochia sp. 3YJGBD-33]